VTLCKREWRAQNAEKRKTTKVTLNVCRSLAEVRPNSHLLLSRTFLPNFSAELRHSPNFGPFWPSLPCSWQVAGKQLEVNHCLEENCCPTTQCTTQNCMHHYVSHSYTLCLKNDTDVAHYDFDAHQPILVIFGRDVAERVCYQMVICHLTSPN